MVTRHVQTDSVSFATCAHHFFHKAAVTDGQMSWCLAYRAALTAKTYQQHGKARLGEVYDIWGKDLAAAEQSMPICRG